MSDKINQVAQEALKNDRFLKALRREPVDRAPIWLMRQAGRYLPEYRATRAEAGDFMSLCKNAELACEVTMQPLRRYPLDAAILFSDILTIPDAMGLGLWFATGEGPQFKHTIQSQADVDALPKLSIETDLDYVLNAVRTIKSALNNDLPLIGFSGSPWTLACYMVEGKGNAKGFIEPKKLAYNQPEVMHALLAKLAEAVADYLIAQIEAGANAVQIFDTWGGQLSDAEYQVFSLDYMQSIVQKVKQIYPHIPVILFTKGGGLWLEKMADTGADCLGLDWTINIGDARKRVGDRVALQGNLDPAILHADPKVIQAKAKQVLKDFGNHPGHIFNLGHGLTPGLKPESVHALVEAVTQS